MAEAATRRKRHLVRPASIHHAFAQLPFAVDHAALTRRSRSQRAVSRPAAWNKKGTKSLGGCEKDCAPAVEADDHLANALARSQGIECGRRNYGAEVEKRFAPRKAEIQLRRFEVNLGRDATFKF